MLAIVVFLFFYFSICREKEARPRLLLPREATVVTFAKELSFRAEEVTVGAHLWRRRNLNLMAAHTRCALTLTGPVLVMLLLTVGGVHGLPRGSDYGNVKGAAGSSNFIGKQHEGKKNK